MDKVYTDYYQESTGKWTAAIIDKHGDVIDEETGLASRQEARTRARELLEKRARVEPQS